MKTMMGAVFEGNGVLKLKEVPVPQVEKADDVIVKVDACGICGSDVAIMSVPQKHPARIPNVLGHEFIGHVAEVGPAVTHVKPGDRIAVAPNLGCGTCPYCVNGMSNHCLDWKAIGVHLDGGFAEYTKAPASAVLPLNPDLPLDEAVFIEPLSCVYAGTSKIAIQPGEKAVVLGAGPIGLIFISVFKASGAGTIIASDIAPFRLEYAKKAGADIVVNPSKENLREIVAAETGSLGAPVVVDSVGSLAAEATHLAAKRGRICLFGVNSTAQPALEQWLITHNELQLFGTFVGTHMFPPSIRMLEAGKLSLAQLLSHRLALKDIHQGFEAIGRGEAIKVMVTP